MSEKDEEYNKKKKFDLDDVLTDNEIISQLKEHGESPESILIKGFVYKSDDPENTVRVYLNLSYDTYVDIPKQAIVAGRKVPNDPFETVYLWVRKGSEIQTVYKKTIKSKAEDFLEGEIARKFARQKVSENISPMELMNQPRRVGQQWMPPDLSWINACPSALIRCDPSQNWEECPPPQSWNYESCGTPVSLYWPPCGTPVSLYWPPCGTPPQSKVFGTCNPTLIWGVEIINLLKCYVIRSVELVFIY